VAEGDGAPGHRHQVRRLGLLEGGRVDAEQRAGAGDQGRVAAGGGRGEQRGPGLRRQAVGPPGEDTGQPGRDGDRRARRERVQQLAVAGELEQRERVAARRLVQPGRGGRGQPGSGRGDQLTGGGG
jgi:hypothetical protein